VLNELPNKITLAGHTDATPYVPGSKSYSNWELSADRANASRRELVSGGMTEQKVLRVMGVASTMDLNKADPLDPINRRISIVVLNRRAQAQIEQENSSGSSAGLKLDGQKDSAGQLRDSVPKPAAAAQP
jgi:chemotaxis protein MotB